jgi:predicted small secreted protein
MTCETLVIGSVVGLALTGAVLSFQVLNDRRTAAKKALKLKKEGRLTADTITV